MVAPSKWFYFWDYPAATWTKIDGELKTRWSNGYGWRLKILIPQIMETLASMQSI